MNIIQGPLPNDYESVNPSQFLATWISGVSIYGLGPAEFKGGSLQFVYSNTDPPALADRAPGMLWYKRGEGRLYTWDYTDDPCGPSSANQYDINWISLSDRRDIWLQSIEAAVPGSMFFLAGTPSGTRFNYVNPTGITSATFDPYLGRPLWTVSLFGTSSTASGIRANCLSGVNFVALETTVSGGKFRAVEFGFCNLLMKGGETNFYGQLTYDANATDVRQLLCWGWTAYSGAGNQTLKWGYTGMLNDGPSGATGYTSGAYVRPGFKWPMSYWQNTGGL